MPRPSAICGKAFLQELGIIAQQQDAEGRIVVDQHAAFAIQHRAARRNDRNRAHAIFFRQIGEMPGINDLQLPEAEQQNQRHANSEVGQQH